MNANELRIGNLVNYRVRDNLDPRKEWLQVSEIDWQDLKVLSHNIGFGFEPIPITEYWLEDFGFEYTHAGTHGKHGWFKNLNEDQEDFFLFFNGHLQCSIFNNLNYLDVEIEHVHQLQNLFFALTGKELEFKKPYDQT